MSGRSASDVQDASVSLSFVFSFCYISRALDSCGTGVDEIIRQATPDARCNRLYFKCDVGIPVEEAVTHIERLTQAQLTGDVALVEHRRRCS